MTSPSLLHPPCLQSVTDLHNVLDCAVLACGVLTHDNATKGRRDIRAGREAVWVLCVAVLLFFCCGICRGMLKVARYQMLQAYLDVQASSCCDSDQ